MGKKNKKPESNIDNTYFNPKTEENIIDFYKSFTPDSDKNIPFPAPYKS